ncbi:MAG TPA: hypothetical protein VE173_11595, partial [Longimicrobiales bacterium]|nr:hypothetical protein [Longimicrobiales bacterium]
DPFKALALGILPGMGQFYSGRTGPGMAVVGLSAAFTTAGLIYRMGRGVTFRSEGLAIGAGIVGLGALEAFVWALRHQDGQAGKAGSGAPATPNAAPGDGRPPRPDSRAATLRGPALTGVSPGLRIRLLGLRF